MVEMLRPFLPIFRKFELNVVSADILEVLFRMFKLKVGIISLATVNKFVI